MVRLLANWRMVAVGTFLAVVLGVLAWGRHEHDAAEKARAVAVAATRQATVDQAAGRALDTYTTKSAAITQRVQTHVQAIQKAPGADSPLPDAVRDSWLAGLRDDGPATSDPPR